MVDEARIQVVWVLPGCLEGRLHTGCPGADMIFSAIFMHRVRFTKAIMSHKRRKGMLLPPKTGFKSFYFVLGDEGCACVEVYLWGSEWTLSYHVSSRDRPQADILVASSLICCAASLAHGNSFSCILFSPPGS